MQDSETGHVDLDSVRLDVYWVCGMHMVVGLFWCSATQD